jgi:diapolycopene oxygenase
MDEVGVKVNLNSEVVKMNKTDGKIKSITLKDGEEHEADIFVSNMEVIPAYEELIGENSTMVEKYKEKFDPTCSGLTLHLGVKKKYNNLFFVGGSVNPGGGMPMVVLSGQQVRDKIIKKFK